MVHGGVSLLAIMALLARSTRLRVTRWRRQLLNPMNDLETTVWPSRRIRRI
jgi:hypothetical protein